MPHALPCLYSLPGVAGEYSGLEHEVVPGVVESLKVRVRAVCPTLQPAACSPGVRRM